MTNPFIAQQQNLPPDLWNDQMEAERARKFAEALQQQSMEAPQGQMAGRVFVAPSWSQYAAKLLQGYNARKGMETADTRTRKTQEEYGRRLSDTMGRAGEMLTGKPESAAPYQADNPFGEDLGDLKTVTPAVAPDRRGAMGVLMQSGIPSLQQAAMGQMLKETDKTKPVVVGRTLMDPNTGKIVGVDSTWQAEQQAAREARNAEQQVAREQRMQELNMRLEDQRLSRQEQASLRRELAQMQDATRRDLATAIGAGSGKPPAGYRWKQDGTLEFVPGGPADPKSKTGADGMPKLTESQGRANLFQSRATEADNIMSGLEGKYSPMAINAKQGAGKVWGIGGALETVGNVMLPQNAQKVEQSQRDFVNAILRQESGAVIAQSEFDNAQKQYFPQPGDSQAVIEQKRKNRKTAIEGLRVMAGPAAAQTREQPQAPAGGATFLGFE